MASTELIQLGEQVTGLHGRRVEDAPRGSGSPALRRGQATIKRFPDHGRDRRAALPRESANPLVALIVDEDLQPMGQHTHTLACTRTALPAGVTTRSGDTRPERGPGPGGGRRPGGLEVWGVPGLTGWYQRRTAPLQALLEKAALALARALDAGPAASGWEDQRWTLARIRDLVAARFRVQYTIPGIWYLLRRRGWSAQLGARRAIERDDGAAGVWKKETWRG